MADVQQFFNESLPQSLAAKPELSKIGETYQFDIDGAGTWTVDLTKTPGEVREGPVEDPGCKVTASAKDFGTLLDNPSAGMMLFTMGKLKVSNPGLALSLQKILS